ncbi:MAG: DUF1223 domain-containing protein [Hyphomicrobiaceae bacterium]|nr:MAG: DUF1223 domain-containing protein [Hyphomicrobiaceae bacterium]
MRIFALLALAAGLIGSSNPAAAQGSAAAPSSATASSPAVVELFTSQGCSSCPAADALLGRLAGRDDVIALSMSVDYWDYLGWKDTLASPKFTERQHAYKASLAVPMVYTPMMVVNGLAHLNGSREDKVLSAIEKTSQALMSKRVPIRMMADKGKLTIEADAAPQAAQAKDSTLWLAVIAKSVDVPITRGENRGHTITYHNVVRELIPVGVWNGSAMTVQLEQHTFMRPGTERCAVLLQQGKAGPIIGAALLKQL